MAKKRPFFSTGVFAIIGRAGGLILPFLIARFFGANNQTDAFFFAYGLVIALTSFFTPLFESILVPLFSKYKKTPDRISDLSNAAVMISLPTVGVISLCVWGLLPWILTHWSGLNDESSQMVVRFYLEMLPMLLIGVWIAGSGSIFYAHHSFWFPAISPAIRFLWVIALMSVFYGKLGMDALTLGFSAGELLRWALGLWILHRLALWKFKTQWHGVKNELKAMFGQVSVQLMAFFAINLIPLSDQFFTSYLGAGSVSLYSYANRLFQVPFQFCLVGMLQVFLSDWSEGFHREERNSLWIRIRRDVRRVLFMSLAVSVLGVLLRDWIVRIAFYYSNLSAEQLGTIASIFGWLIAGFAPAVLHLMYVRILFVTKRSKVFFTQAWLKLVMNILFNYLFMKLFGIQGIAMSSTMVFAVTALWLHIYAEKHILREEPQVK